MHLCHKSFLVDSTSKWGYEAKISHFVKMLAVCLLSLPRLWKRQSSSPLSLASLVNRLKRKENLRIKIRGKKTTCQPSSQKRGRLSQILALIKSVLTYIFVYCLSLIITSFPCIVPLYSSYWQSAQPQSRRESSVTYVPHERLFGYWMKVFACLSWSRVLFF